MEMISIKYNILVCMHSIMFGLIKGMLVESQIFSDSAVLLFLD